MIFIINIARIKNVNIKNTMLYSIPSRSVLPPSPIHKFIISYDCVLN